MGPLILDLGYTPLCIYVYVYFLGTPLDKCVRIYNYGILTERIYMLFIIPVILLNVCGLLMAVAGQPLFGLALCGLSFLYIAKQFID